MKLLFLTMTSSLAVLGRALDVSVPLRAPKIGSHREHASNGSLRFLAGDIENTQCYNETETIAEEIESRGATTNVHIQCSDTNYCETDARFAVGYDNYIDTCVELNGQNYKYHLICDVTVEAPNFRKVIAFRWSNMAGCFGPVCSISEITEQLEEASSSLTQTDSTGGAEITDAFCYAEDLTNSDGTVVNDRVELDVDVSTSAATMSWMTLPKTLEALLISVLVVTPLF